MLVIETVWLNLLHDQKRFEAFNRLGEVINVMGFVAVSLVFPLLNMEQLLNIEEILVAFVKFEIETRWLNTLHTLKSEDIFNKLDEVFSVIGFNPSLDTLPLLKMEHPLNIKDISDTCVILLIETS